MEETNLKKGLKKSTKHSFKTLKSEGLSERLFIEFLHTGFITVLVKTPLIFEEKSVEKLFYSEKNIEKIKPIIEQTKALNRLILQFDNQFIKFLYLKFLDASKNDITHIIKIPKVLSETKYKIIFWNLLFNSANQQNFEKEFKNLITIVSKKHPKKKVIELLNFGILLSDKKIKNNTGIIPSPPYLKERKNRVIFNSGLILFYLYFVPLFNELGFLNNHVLLSEKKEKAVYILHYLACKKQHPFEFQIQLEKIICGIPPEQSVNRFINLTDVEKEICETFLDEMIVKLNIPDVTTATELQTKVFNRFGTITVHNHTLRLNIDQGKENSNQDLLSIPSEKLELPWQTEVLHINW